MVCTNAHNFASTTGIMMIVRCEEPLKILEIQSFMPTCNTPNSQDSRFNRWLWILQGSQTCGWAGPGMVSSDWDWLWKIDPPPKYHEVPNTRIAKKFNEFPQLACLANTDRPSRLDWEGKLDSYGFSGWQNLLQWSTPCPLHLLIGTGV